MPWSWEDFIPVEGDEPYPSRLSWLPAIALAVLIAAVVILFVVLT